MICTTCAAQLVPTWTTCPTCGSPTGFTPGVAPKATALIRIGWLTAILFPVAGLIIGIVVCTKRHLGHGVGQILVSVVWGVPFMAIVFSIAFPYCGGPKEKAYVAAMRSDLRNLATAEESYFADNRTYATSVEATGFTPWDGVTVTIGAASRTGWNATATHRSIPGTVCAVYGGGGPAVAPAVTAGEPTRTPIVGRTTTSCP